ncbi:dTDP-4-dehydrorhamnose 3,5-epimerase [Hyphomonas neptunium ATCC 15444]|uniref:dTDP-4-dehydrorhamnose 3,5-epimerase n=1 Tax=Hyphomonas neptunium (strain ATCC 15444) TaxID=228405 RepID=Q0C436_HYPNA|nr:dTDP-4-dehydrorhamnose 3,5-epimerase [Hyphomonas neptunium ATCC 15444]
MIVTSDDALPEVLHVLPARHTDGRGWFSETYNRSAFFAAGIDFEFVQDNQSRSEKAGTVRGLHFQKPPHEQVKLVRCLQGRILDLVVDIRPGSPRFGKFTAVELSAINGRQLLIPAGFAHGFCSLDDGCEIYYKVSAHYAPQSDAGVAFDDPEIGIHWPFPTDSLILSDKDRRLPALKDCSDLVWPAAVGLNR